MAEEPTDGQGEGQDNVGTPTDDGTADGGQQTQVEPTSQQAPGNFDKGLQQVQQTLASVERANAELQARLDSMEKPTEPDAGQSPVIDFGGDANDDDYMTGGTMKRFMQQQQEATQAMIDAAMGPLAKQMSDRQEAEQADRFRSDFEQQHPGVNYDEVLAEATKQLDDPADLINRIARQKAGTNKPAATRPSSPAGSRITPSGASPSQQAQEDEPTWDWNNSGQKTWVDGE